MIASSTKADARRTFDRWAGSYERDPFSRWIARHQREAVEALELERGDRTSDAVVSKVFDFLARKFEAGHVGLQRVDGLRRLLENAGLERAETRPAWGGIYGMALGRRAA